jgi:hypothetical protein
LGQGVANIERVLDVLAVGADTTVALSEGKAPTRNHPSIFEHASAVQNYLDEEVA